MTAKSKIPYLQSAWNCVQGCSPASTGCAGCYAERLANRFSGVPGHPWEGLTKNGRWTGQVRLDEKHLEDPLHWREPRTIGVCFLSDLFNESVPGGSFLGRILAIS